MAKVIAGMTTALDGFVADRRGSAERLYPDLAALRGSAYMTAAVDETGAVLMGRRTFEMSDADDYLGAYEFQVPIFVLAHAPPPVPPKQDERLTFTFVTDGVAAGVAQAKAAAWGAASARRPSTARCSQRRTSSSPGASPLRASSTCWRAPRCSPTLAPHGWPSYSGWRMERPAARGRRSRRGRRGPSGCLGAGAGHDAPVRARYGDRHVPHCGTRRRPHRE